MQAVSIASTELSDFRFDLDDDLSDLGGPAQAPRRSGGSTKALVQLSGAALGLELLRRFFDDAVVWRRRPAQRSIGRATHSGCRRLHRRRLSAHLSPRRRFNQLKQVTADHHQGREPAKGEKRLCGTRMLQGDCPSGGSDKSDSANQSDDYKDGPRRHWGR